MPPGPPDFINFDNTSNAALKSPRPQARSAAARGSSEFAVFPKWVNLGFEQTEALSRHKQFKSPDIGQPRPNQFFAPVIIGSVTVVEDNDVLAATASLTQIFTGKVTVIEGNDVLVATASLPSVPAVTNYYVTEDGINYYVDEFGNSYVSEGTQPPPTGITAFQDDAFQIDTFQIVAVVPSVIDNTFWVDNLMMRKDDKTINTGANQFPVAPGFGRGV